MSAQAARIPDDDPSWDAESWNAGWRSGVLDSYLVAKKRERAAYALGLLNGAVWAFLGTLGLLLLLTFVWWAVR